MLSSTLQRSFESIEINGNIGKQWVNTLIKTRRRLLSFIDIQHVPACYNCREHVPACYNCREQVPACYNCREHVPATYNCREHVPATYNCREK